MKRVDKLNSLFNSKNPDDIIEFYSKFKDTEELINWSRNRPHGRAKIYEVNGKKDVIVVIPTADRFSKITKNCEKIFKGQHIIFVESAINDPYFKFARNSNIGLKYALRYKPKWILLSNDDVSKVDDIEVLLSELKKIDNRRIKLVYHDISSEKYLYKQTALLKLLKRLGFNAQRNPVKYSKKEFMKYRKDIYNLEKKFKIEYDFIYSSPLRRLLYKKMMPGTGGKSYFMILSYYAVKNRRFDETFINDYEDMDFISRIKPSETTETSFRINRYNHGGKNLGRGLDRRFRDILNQAYLSYLVRKGRYGKIK
mgnify:CR=1 FL=1